MGSAEGLWFAIWLKHHGDTCTSGAFPPADCGRTQVCTKGCGPASSKERRLPNGQHDGGAGDAVPVAARSKPFLQWPLARA